MEIGQQVLICLLSLIVLPKTNNVDLTVGCSMNVLHVVDLLIIIAVVFNSFRVTPVSKKQCLREMWLLSALRHALFPHILNNF